MVKAVKARFKEASPVLPSREGGQTARVSCCKNSIIKMVVWLFSRLVV